MVKNVMLNQVLNHALKQVQGLTNSGSSISASNKTCAEFISVSMAYETLK
jgi:hypothetical protein